MRKKFVKFPARRAIWINEWLSVLKLFLYSAITEEDPGYSGYYRQKYSKNLSDFLSKEKGYVFPACSGTNALYIALKAIPKTETKNVVHVSAITDPGSIAAIIDAGYKINVIDSESPQDGQSSLSSLKNALNRFKTSSAAFLLVHHAGWLSTNIYEFKRTCQQYNCAFIEDISQAHGAKLEDEIVGSFGDISAGSTMYRKNFVTGGCGGFVYTQDKLINQEVMLHGDRGKPIWQNNFYDNFLSNRDGNNVKFSALNHAIDNISLAIGISSLSRLPKTIEKRQRIVNSIKEKINRKLNLIFPNSEKISPSPFIIPITFNSAEQKKLVVNCLLENQIPFNPDYRFLVSDWGWIKQHLVEDSLYPKNARKYLDMSIFLYLNERYSAKNCSIIAELINKSLA